MYTIKDVSKMLGLTSHTIRYYTDQELVPFVKRDKNNIRLFDDVSIKCLVAIKHFRNCGLSIDEIKHYMLLCKEGESTLNQRYEIILKQKEKAELQLKEDAERLQYLTDKVERYNQLLKNGGKDIMNPANWSDNLIDGLNSKQKKD